MGNVAGTCAKVLDDAGQIAKRIAGWRACSWREKEKRGWRVKRCQFRFRPSASS
jgi:hypothetical protein